MKNKIYYVFDTMCGWSYGNSDVITKIEEKYKDVYDFILVPGGMMTGDKSKKMSSSLKDYIKGHNLEVEKATGISFGEGYNKNILENNTAVLDSFPGSKAVVIVQNIKKEVAFRFLKKIQDAFFVDGSDMNNISVYTKIAESFNISKEEFEKDFNSETIRQQTFECFDKSNSLGVKVFPTIVLVEQDNKTTIISEGFNSFENLDKILEF
jgi:putative protein-disulfide isomerase